MGIDGISPAGVSDQKLLETQQDAQVRLLKKEGDQKASIEGQLIAGATESAPPKPGVGDKLNIVA